MNRTLFDAGLLLITPAAHAALGRCRQTALGLLARHVTGDWRGMTAADRAANAAAVREGDRILSSYALAGKRFWVITEADRSATTILLPEEY
jgi:hypothetical protein